MTSADIPQHDAAIERAVLGTALQEPETTAEIVARTSSEHFYITSTVAWPELAAGVRGWTVRRPCSEREGRGLGVGAHGIRWRNRTVTRTTNASSSGATTMSTARARLGA